MKSKTDLNKTWVNVLVIIISYLAYQFTESIFLIEKNQLLGLFVTIASVSCVAILIALFIKAQDNDQEFQSMIHARNKINYKIVLLSFTGIIVTSYLIQQLSIIMKVIDSTSKNQNVINNFATQPIGKWYVLVMTIILGPIVEEFIFRRLWIGNPVKNKYRWLRITTSIIIFTFAHMESQYENLTQTLTTPEVAKTIIATLVYLSMSCWFTFAYVKTNNIKTSIAVHMLNNLTVSMPVIISLF